MLIFVVLIKKCFKDMQQVNPNEKAISKEDQKENYYDYYANSKFQSA